MKRNEVAPLKLGKKEPAEAKVNYRDPKNWPSSLQKFITRCFTKSNELNFNKELKDHFQLQLKKIIDKAIEEEKVDKNDWDRQKLPIFDYSFKKLELMCNLAPTSSTSQSGTNGTAPKGKAGSAKSNNIKTSATALKLSDNVGKPVSMKIPKANSGKLPPSVFEKHEETIITPKKRQNQPAPSSEKSAKKARLERFAVENAAIVNASSPSPVVPSLSTSSLFNDGAIVGTCETIEKNYLRLTSEPKPEMVRPLRVLKQTLKLLRTKYEREKDYNYLKNQLKSLRQDLTVQHIKTKFTIKAYEFHAKIAIEFKDLGEFNQCQSQLKQLYQMKIGNGRFINKYEFLSYRVLYFIITKDYPALMSLKLALMKEPSAMTNEFIVLAFKLWDYSLTSNYHDFFQLLSQLSQIDEVSSLDKGEVNDEDDEVSMNNLNHPKFYYFTKMVNDFIVERQLLTSFSILANSYRKVSIEFLAQEFFNNDQDKLTSFIESKNCLQFVENDFFELAKARSTIHDLVSTTRKVDIKGQI